MLLLATDELKKDYVDERTGELPVSKYVSTHSIFMLHPLAPPTPCAGVLFTVTVDHAHTVQWDRY